MLRISQQREQAHKKRIIALFVVILLLAGLFCWVAVKLFVGNKSPVPQQKVIEKSKVIPVGLQSKLAFFGDVYWGRYINDWAQASSLKEAYPFSRLNEFDRQKYDAWIADLECPVVEGISIPSNVENETLNFNCSPKYLGEAAKWFNVFSNANNHSDNQGGQAGLDETRKHLEENKIQYFGHFDPRELDDVCEVIAMPVRVELSNNKEQKGRLPVAMCGFHGIFRVPPPESLEMISHYSKIMPVVAYPHMGVEYQPEADQLRQNLYRIMIDQGADMVLGDHPHWVQNSEAYKGRLIVYSMGNFIFDQQLRPETTRSAGIELNLRLAGQKANSQLQAWLNLGEKCAQYKDDCLAQAEKQKLTKLPLSFEFSVVGTDNYNKIAKPASSEIQASILQRLGWGTTISQLQSPYSGK
jgi:hypothetical protein